MLPSKSDSTSLRPQAPWFSDGLCALKREKRQWERKRVESGLVVHKQLYIYCADCAGKYYFAINESRRAHYNNTVSNSNQKQIFHRMECLFNVQGSPTLPTHHSPQYLTHRLSVFFSGKIKALTGFYLGFIIIV